MHQTQRDPVHMDPDGQWYFFNETWAERYGPYPDDKTARNMLGQYIQWINSQRVEVQQDEAPRTDAAAADTITTTTDMETAVGEFLRLRGIKQELENRHKEELAGVNEQLKAGEVYLMEALQRMGVDSFKVSTGTVYTSTRLFAGIGDKGALMDHIRNTGEVELLQSRVSTETLRTWMETHGGECPPGVKATYERVIGVRRK